MSRISRPPLLLALLLATVAAAAACDDDDGADDSTGTPDAGPPDFPVNGTLVPASDEGRRPAGRVDDGLAILPGGRAITPAGTQIEVGGFLLGVRLLPGGVHALVTDGGYYDNYLTVVELASGQLLQREPFEYAQGRGLFLGMAQRADGRIFASGGGTDAIFAYDYDPGAIAPALPLTQVDELAMPAGAFVAGMAFADANRLVVAWQGSDNVAIVDTGDGSLLGMLSLFGDDNPYDVAVDQASQRAYVSMWGSGKVAVLDVSGDTPALVTEIATGKNPSALLLVPPAAPDRLLVAASDSDRVEVVSLATNEIVDSIAAGDSVDAPRGSSPNHLALSPDGSRLYVANAGENCIDAFAVADGTRLGRVPTAWYPTAVAVAADGSLAIANAKGMGGGPSGGNGFDYGIMRGTLQLVPAPDEAALAAGLAAVDANNRRMRVEGPKVTCPPAPESCRFPLPPAQGLPTPIEHVVLIVRENKTYDATLGDLGTDADGDPNLVIFGEQYTPNLHALAREFVNGDNFYANAEASIQGHVATTGAQVNDFTEKAWLTTWGREQRNIADFSKSISLPENGTYFQRLGRAGIDYMNYGEIVGLAGAGPGDDPVVFDPAWPGGIIFNTSEKDTLRAAYFASEVAAGRLARVTYMLLPNNHTEGLTPGKWTPEFMVADNDAATGMVVEAIANSPFWYTSIIFIIEDDPQDGADHVEAHRSTLVVVSPWVKRHYTSKVNYDVASLWATIELLVGLPHGSLVTAQASPMFDIFADTPDFGRYSHIPSNVPEAFNPQKPSRLAEISSRMDFTTIDNAPGLGRVLWEHMRGTPAPWSSMPLPLDYEDEVEIPLPGLGGARDDDD